MQNVEGWMDLYQSEDLRRVRIVATCLAAMEFDVRLECRGEHEARCDAHDCVPPYAVRVPAADFAQLIDVLDEIIEEQEQFDEFLDRWHDRARQSERRLLIAMIVIVGALAAVGAIEV